MLSDVATNIGAIGVVNVASLPPDLAKSGVKILGLVDGKNTYRPSVEAILSGAYPYAERFYLYVHPKASFEAKDFAKMLAEPGRWAKAFAEQGFVRTMPQPQNDSPHEKTTIDNTASNKVKN